MSNDSAIRRSEIGRRLHRLKMSDAYLNGDRKAVAEAKAMAEEIEALRVGGLGPRTRFHEETQKATEK